MSRRIIQRIWTRTSCFWSICTSASFLVGQLPRLSGTVLQRGSIPYHNRRNSPIGTISRQGAAPAATAGRPAGSNRWRRRFQPKSPKYLVWGVSEVAWIDVGVYTEGRANCGGRNAFANCNRNRAGLTGLNARRGQRPRCRPATRGEVSRVHTGFVGSGMSALGGQIAPSSSAVPFLRLGSPVVGMGVSAVIGLAAMAVRVALVNAVADQLEPELQKPGREAGFCAEKMLLLVAGVPLILPGFFDHGVGLLLLSPGIRRLVVQLLPLFGFFAPNPP